MYSYQGSIQISGIECSEIDPKELAKTITQIDIVDERAELGEHKSTIYSVNPGYIEKIDEVVVLNGLKITFSGWGRSHWVRFEIAPE